MEGMGISGGIHLLYIILIYAVSSQYNIGILTFKYFKGGKPNLRNWIGLILGILLLLSGCTNHIDFIEKGPFVKLELYSASEGTYLDYFPKLITISNDGSVRVFTKEMVDN